MWSISSPSLLEVAADRCRHRGWKHVHDLPRRRHDLAASRLVDVVTFSYSLTMIPDWFAAIQNALAMLRPGGLIGVVDFYVSRKFPAEKMARHGWLTRHFWPTWFSQDNVFPSSDHLPFLRQQTVQEQLDERVAKIPYLPLVRAPYYRYVGRKPA